MAEITITIPPSQMQKVRDHVGRARAPSPDDTGPLTDDEMLVWLKEEIIGFLKREAKEKEWIATRNTLKANIPEIDFE